MDLNLDALKNLFGKVCDAERQRNAFVLDDVLGHHCQPPLADSIEVGLDL